MKTLAQQMAVYAAYHQDPRNRLTHFVGVPAIIFAILIPMSWLRFSIGGFEISLAMVFAGSVLVYYYILDVALGIALTVFLVLILWLTETLATRLTVVEGAWLFVIAFLGGWVFQLVGHAFEGRRPALVDNFWQVFVAPVFLMAEVFFAMGLKQDVKRKADELFRQGAETIASR